MNSPWRTLLLMAFCLPAWSGEAALRDCAECPAMRAVPGGAFEMGSPADEAGRFANEGPVHRVVVPPFFISEAPVTRAEFAAFVKETGYDAGAGCWTLTKTGDMAIQDGYDWRNPGYAQAPDHPAVCISWHDAQAYTQWLSRKSGQPYRLPTEAQWEYAARGGTATARYWGEQPAQACAHANVWDRAAKRGVPVRSAAAVHACDDGYAYTSPVASFQANAFGLYDMLGNVLQWTEDCSHPDYTGAPADGSAWRESGCGARVARGGAWSFEPRVVRAAARNFVPAGLRNLAIGIRVVRSAP